MEISNMSHSATRQDKSVRLRKLFGRLARNRLLYLMLLPGLLYFVIYKYLPMYGIVIAFQNYQPFLGIRGSEWVGFDHFARLFDTDTFWPLFRNTMILAVLNMIFFFPLPIFIALMLNEVRVQWFKRLVQTLVYIPHFMSWVVVIGIVYIFLNGDNGIVNELLKQAGHKEIPFLVSAGWFRPLIILEVIWKETGWGTIIFLAALAGIDTEVYEAAIIDGASRWKRVWHVSLPAIRSTIVILLILRLGHFLDTGFEQIFLMLNSLNREVGDVFDTYVFTSGIQQGQFSYSAAVGLFKSVVGLILVVSSNYLARKFGEEGVY